MRGGVIMNNQKNSPKKGLSKSTRIGTYTFLVSLFLLVNL